MSTTRSSDVPPRRRLWPASLLSVGLLAVASGSCSTPEPGEGARPADTGAARPDSGPAPSDTASPATDTDPSGACARLPPTPRDGEGPAPLLASPAFASRPPDLGIRRDRVTVTSRQVGGRTLLVVRASVISFTERLGAPWVHDVVVVAPEAGDLRTTDTAALSLNLGTADAELVPGAGEEVWGGPAPAWYHGTGSTEEMIATFGSVAFTHGIPFVGTDPVPARCVLDAAQAAAVAQRQAELGDPCPEDCAGALTTDREKQACLMLLVRATGDAALDPGLNFAVAASRVVDAAEQLLEEAYADRGQARDLDWRALWAMGGSKRASAVRNFGAIDRRVKGMLVAAADIGNLPAFCRLQEAVWAQGRAHCDAGDTALDSSVAGRTLLGQSDPAWWRPDVLGGQVYVMAVGTNDHHSPLGAILTYFEDLPARRHLLLVPNCGHGVGTIDHAAAFRALVDHGMNATPWPTLEAAWEADGRVRATVRGDGQVSRVDLWCVTGNGTGNPQAVEPDAECNSVALEPDDTSPDLRHARWTKVTMTRQAGDDGDADRTWRATPPACGLTWCRQGDAAWCACVARGVTVDEKPFTSLPLLPPDYCTLGGLPVGESLPGQ